ncbi:CTP-dependent riboflavin kinase [Candidatus Micrarchaeota archaeon]|nr:CTP-dependent riboflavin kinase [Candidatus Micrarchaeota archaeon]
MDKILLLLLRLGAQRNPVRITTSDLGAEAEMSQQNASRRLALLEKNGYLERKKGEIRITKKGMDEIAGEYSIMKKAFDSRIEISGIITEGLGEGKYYMSLKGYREQIREKLGFDPHPGTLNIKTDKGNRNQILAGEPAVISGFTDRNRTYGDIFAFPCKIEGEVGAVIVPLRTSHGQDILEIISGFDIKKKFGKKNGDRIMVII